MNTLQNKQVADVLKNLHEKATADHYSRQKAKQKAAENGETIDHLRATSYMAISPEKGSFLYFLATLQKAKHLVEFGCSFGISTIYLAAAARDNGGNVISTDIETNKVTGAQKNLKTAGLKNLVDILQGDAMQTLSSVKGSIDFLFLDGAKELYLPVFKMLRPKLTENAVIIADNVDKPETQVFVDYILQHSEEFTSTILFENKIMVAYLNNLQQ